MNKKTWNRYAPVYRWVMSSGKNSEQRMYTRIAEKVKGKEVLEIAAGPGTLAKFIAPSARTVVATDYAEGMIEVAKKGVHPDNLVFAVADATDLPYEAERFDVVVIANALHIIPDNERVLDEIARVLKADGLLVAPNFVQNDGGAAAFWRKILKFAGIRFAHEWSTEEYHAFLRGKGWKIQYATEFPAKNTLAYVECVRGEEASRGETR